MVDLKVLMISFDPSAAAKGAKHTGDLQKRLVEYGRHLERLYCIAYTPAERSLYAHQRLGDNVEVFPTFSSNPLMFILHAYRIGSEICRREGIDIITTQDPIFCGIAGLVLKYRYRKPLLVQVHGDSLDNKYWLRERKVRYLLNAVGKFVLRRADGVRVVSERVKRRVVRMGVEERRIFKLPIFVDVKKFSDAEGGEVRQRFSDYDNIVLFVGRLAREKNIPNLLRAAAIVVEKFPRTLFLIVGDGPERRRLEILAEELQIANNVVFEGQVEHELLPAYYKACDIFVLPSDHEGWGLVLVEAMAAGRAVVSTDVGLAGELLEDGVSGVVVPRRDERALADAIIRLISDERLRSRIAREGRRRVMQQSHEAGGRLQLEMYRRVAELASS